MKNQAINLWKKANGKKLPIALILSLAGAGVGYGELKGKVGDNCDDINTLKPLIAQTARIDERVIELKEDFIDFRKEQRVMNKDHRDLMMKIYEKVK